MKRLGITLFLLLCSTGAFAIGPCCGIKSINTNTGVVVAVPNQPPDGGHYSPVDGFRAFEFTVRNAAVLRSLKVGDPVGADFAKKLAIIKSGERFPLRLTR